MLKIKDNVDLKELEKYGFTYDEDWYYDFVPYNKHDNTGSYISVLCYFKAYNRQLDFVHIQPEDFGKAACILYDLIQAGLVEKVEVKDNE
jgi:hypothetical protein